MNRVAVDIYSEDVVTDWKAAKAAGIQLVIHKATEGVTIHDKAYADRRKAATDAGLMWAAYHFGRGTDVDQQIGNFLTHAQPDATTRCVLDWEVPAMSKAQVIDFLGKLDKKLGRITVLYSYESFLFSQLGSMPNDFLGAHPLYIAAYHPAPLRLQSSWKRFLMHQYTDGRAGPMPHDVPGMPGSESGVDCDHSDLAPDAFRAFWTCQTDVWPDNSIPLPWAKLTFTLRPGGDMRTAWVQDSLTHLGYGVLAVDGVQGTKTTAAVTQFQTDRRLTIDGIIGDETTDAISAALAAQAKGNQA